jgi:ribosomal 50S subunit-associated protein YjgA (DUF615 family)
MCYNTIRKKRCEFSKRKELKTMKRTQNELKPIIKHEVDTFITELMAQYPEIAKTSLQDFVRNEADRAMYEIAQYGEIKSNKKRWGK